MNAESLMEEARKIAGNAYVPYSKFRVGAALELSDGTVITGVNVENRSFGLTNCAERSAIYTALSQGRKDIVAIAVAGPDATEPLSPCGACRQVIAEFCPPDTPVYFDDAAGGWIDSSVKELLPMDALQGFRNRN